MSAAPQPVARHAPPTLDFLFPECAPRPYALPGHVDFVGLRSGRDAFPAAYLLERRFALDTVLPTGQKHGHSILYAVAVPSNLSDMIYQMAERGHRRQDGSIRGMPHFDLDDGQPAVVMRLTYLGDRVLAEGPAATQVSLTQFNRRRPNEEPSALAPHGIGVELANALHVDGHRAQRIGRAYAQLAMHAAAAAGAALQAAHIPYIHHGRVITDKAGRQAPAPLRGGTLVERAVAMHQLFKLAAGEEDIYAVERLKEIAHGAPREQPNSLRRSERYVA